MNQPQSKSQQDELPSIHANEVKGLDCPACGHPTLMIFNGYITCTLADCPNPDFADSIAQEANKARIDELEIFTQFNDVSFANRPATRVVFMDRLEERIAELTAQNKDRA